MFGILDNPNANTLDALNERICLLQQVNESADGYQLVIPVAEDSTQCLSSHRIFTLRNKCLFLVRAYQLTIKKMGIGTQWICNCYQPAVTS